METDAFKIYNASAGSGKTFTLVKEYLKIILGSPNPDRFKYILAITFTNKAVNEMKSRIINQLSEIGQFINSESPDSLFQQLQKELGISGQTLQNRSKKTLHYILHNYAFFDISTIDKFNHRLIKTFARDLLLPQNFEVVLDTEIVLNKAVDRVIAKLGSDREITSLLLQFAIEKLEDDKSWDISLDLYKISSLLTQENHLPFFKKLEQKTLGDFKKLREFTFKNIKDQKAILKECSNSFLELVNKNNIAEDHFTRGSLPGYFRKLQAGVLPSLGAKWQEDIETSTLYPGKVSEHIPQAIDRLQPEIATIFLKSKDAIIHINFLQNLLKNIVPLAILNAIQYELNQIKKEENILLISEFNKILSETIKNQPAPFIYERLGEKYRNYFIDEFQDTSQMQWENLIPLIGSALEGENLKGETGSLFLVGDAKQAIYRWRGGKASQFIALFTKKTNPFQFHPTVANLPINYRSLDNLVSFTNSFFKSIAPFLNNDVYHKLFKNHSAQKNHGAPGGIVSIEFLNRGNSNHVDDLYLEKTLKTILNLQGSGTPLKDICILTRKKKHGLSISEYLAQHNIPVISSETLLIKNNIAVLFLINILCFSREPENRILLIDILTFLAEKEQTTQKHSFIKNYLDHGPNQLFSTYNFDLDKFKGLNLFDGIMYTIQCFNLAHKSDGYLQYFMEVVYNFVAIEENDTYAFIEYWDEKKDSLSITAPHGTNAVEVMTIHKSKGLEFPIVIFPFANTYIYEEIDPKIWLPIPENNLGFSHFLFNKKKDLQSFNDSINQIYNSENQQIELDGINLLYVALTRAIRGLYIITENKDNPAHFSGLFIHFLKQQNLWDTSQERFVFGEEQRVTSKSAHHNNSTNVVPFPKQTFNEHRFNLVTRSGSLWGSPQEKAIEKGDLVHLIMSKIKKATDTDQAIQETFGAGLIKEQKLDFIHTIIKNVISHSELVNYFSGVDMVKNEVDIYTKDGRVMRPDRLNINTDNEVVIIDYKTGDFNKNYGDQLNDYARALEEMGFITLKKILVFINEDVSVQYI